MTYRDAPAVHPLVFLSDDTAVALERGSGRELWRYACPRRIARVLLAYGCVYLLDNDCVLHCLRSTDGTLLRRAAGGESTGYGAALIAEDNVIYVATTGGVRALTPDGQQRWDWRSPLPALSQLPGLALPNHVCQPDFKE